MPNQYEKLVEQQARLKQKIEREDFKLRQSKYYENRQARKARSRRLIQKGALLEKYFQADNLSVEQTEELLNIFADYVNAHKPDKLELKLVEDEISKRTQNHLKDFVKNNLEVKPKNNPENKNDQPSY